MTHIMGDGTEFDDDGDLVEAEEEDSRPIMYALRGDARKHPIGGPPDKIWDFVEEVFDPNPLRSHVITLHLYVEYWLNKLLEVHGIDDDLTFAKKTQSLHEAGALEELTYGNIVTINRLRNLYAHELDLAKVKVKVQELLGQLKVDKNFDSTDKDVFRTVCFQTMFTLDSTVSNAGQPPGLEPYPHEAVRQQLLQEGELFWQQCEVLEADKRGFVETFKLRCPLCGKGTIRRERDTTPGFRDSMMWPCETCGLDGDGSTLHLKTARAEFGGRKP